LNARVFAASRRCEFSRGFQSTERNARIAASRQRRLNPGVADVTQGARADFQALKRLAKVIRH